MGSQSSPPASGNFELRHHPAKYAPLPAPIWQHSSHPARAGDPHDHWGWGLPWAAGATGLGSTAPQGKEKWWEPRAHSKTFGDAKGFSSEHDVN